MAVALVYLLLAVEGVGLGALIQHARVGAKPQGTADILDADLVRHDVYHRVGGVRVELSAVGVPEAHHISCKLHNGKLHAKAQAQERNPVLTCVADGQYFAVNAPASKAAGHENAADIPQELLHIVGSDSL